MNLEHYPYSNDSNLFDYEFYSEAPNGKILKKIRFVLRTSNNISYYNLGFGDWNETKQSIDDFKVSNNKDAEKVLATVASTVMNFTNHFRDAIVYAQGSTNARTRLYQMGINKFWDDILLVFEVYGLTDIGWEEFKSGKNYDAFLVKRKQ